MNKEEFFEKLKEISNKIDIELNDKQLDMFYEYMNLLIEWNEKINLTAITDPDDIIIKHFVDSLSIFKALDKGKSIIDVGTGAGFPGIPIKIYDKDAKITLLDSLNKRILYLEDVIKSLDLRDIKTIHGRAEEIAQKSEYRQNYDVATSRAVASLNVLVEYLMPYVKVGGKCICMKGPDIEEELQNAQKAISVLGGEVENVINFKLPNSEFERNLVVIKKVKNTQDRFPRKAGTPSKEPII